MLQLGSTALLLGIPGFSQGLATFFPKLGYMVLLIGVLVFVHELGHFLVAKACGVKVLRFSIGFGPRILGIQRGETEYRLSWFPLGGYVKMAGDMPHEDLPPEEARRGFLAQPPWKRGLIVAAGPAFNLIFPVLAYFFVYWGGHETLSTRIGSVEPGMPAAEAKLQPGDRILAVDGERVETFEELIDVLRPRHSHEVNLTVEREGRQFSTQLTPTRAIDANPIRPAPRGMIGISPYARPAIVGVPAGSAAEVAGLRTFDRILSINGQPVRDEVAFRRVVSEASGTLELQVQRDTPLDLPGVGGRAPSLVTVRMEKQPGEGYDALGVERADLYVAQVTPGSPAARAGIQPGDRLVSINGEVLQSSQILSNKLQELADQPFTLRWRSGTQGEKDQQLSQVAVEDPMGEMPRSFELGVRLAPLRVDTSSAEKIVKHLNAGQALAASLRVVPEIIGQTAVVLGRLFTGSVPLSTVGGPLMIAEVASRSAEEGLDSFLGMMAVISINLGLVNLLPIPILDGFQLLASLWEGVRRRAIPVRTREIANWIGLVMLVMLMVIAMRNDLIRLFSR